MDIERPLEDSEVSRNGKVPRVAGSHVVEQPVGAHTAALVIDDQQPWRCLARQFR
jgi:hypothetical protein